MPPQLISLKPKPPAQTTLTPSTNTEATPAYPDKASFPTIDRKDELPVKRKATLQPEDDDRTIDPTPKYDRSEPTDTRRTQRGYSARQTPGRVRPPRVSRAFESKFHALEKRQKNLVQQTKQKGQLEYLTVSRSSSGKYWITIEGSGRPFIRISFETPEFCYECALELEDTFDVLQVLSLRPGETIERIEEMIGVWLDRERVARAWG
ncbi:hypothetical protein HRE53_31330 (plasmid) [Acaryochloris sp. 'Moss Beach']|uniref:hypothetical protein n=1 Tax=Acaryochloris sp. 'Moss Beach' TaxID=2740837 RepID=UPI001F1E7FD7|nr:hypothetical protein [Acaryochloris sp. 'Moss Beach']UJB73072.1 hypothetical protein HRE53_31330 [Acaryochloris sp. 'Moss Beach']